jgi:hypothetical protein
MDWAAGRTHNDTAKGYGGFKGGSTTLSEGASNIQRNQAGYSRVQ